MLTVARNILILNTILCCLRLMNVISASYQLGPLMITIGKMLQDVRRFLAIFFLFSFTFTIVFMALFSEQPEMQTKLYPSGTLFLPFWAFVGEYGSSIDWLNPTYIGPILLWVYLILANVMLANLLIAMMADTYSNIRDNSDKEWKFSQYYLVNEYELSGKMPGPLNLLQYIYQFFTSISDRLHATQEPKEHDEDVALSKKRNLKKIMQIKRDQMLEKFEMDQNTEGLRNQIEQMKEKMDFILNNVQGIEHRAQEREALRSK